MGLNRLMSIAVAVSAISTSVADAQVRISEWQYNGSEYVEFTNYGALPVDMTGWSFDDDSRAPGTTDLSSFGIVAPGEAVVMSEVSALDFRTEWMLPLSVKIVGSNAANLSRADEINLFDSIGALVDRLTYGDQVYPLPLGGSIRTAGISGNPTSLAVLELDDVGAIGDWVLSSVGDSYGSYESASDFIGNPGNVAPIPEPATIILWGMAAVSLAAAVRRR